MMRGVNSIINKVDGFNVDWWQDWHNIAFSLAKKKAEGEDIKKEEALADSKLKMFDTAAYDQFEILMSEGSAKIEDGLVQKTVDKLEADLEEIYYKRNGAIGVYQMNKVAHFVMITGVPISDDEKALKAKSEAFGKYAFELINEYRAGVEGTNLAAIEWSQDLFDVAYAHAKDISLSLIHI